jgi:hypothetical protein
MFFSHVIIQGRLEEGAEPQLEDILGNIEQLKRTILKDAINPITNRPFFDPTLQQRTPRKGNKNLFKIIPCSNDKADKRMVKALRTAFKKELLHHDFLTPQLTEM